MTIKRICLCLIVVMTALMSLSAVEILPFFEFDFDAYIDSYGQLILNDVVIGGNEKPYYSSLEKALLILSSDTDTAELQSFIRNDDRAVLKTYLQDRIDNGTRMSDEEILGILFNPEEMYSAYVSPTTDSAMSFFGHNFLMFYIPDAPMLSPCMNFYAYYEHLGAIGTVVEGLKGNLVSYYDFKPFAATYLDYTAFRDRSIAMSRIHLDAGKDRVWSVLETLQSGEYPNYSFLFYNCSHGLMDLLERFDDSIVFENDRALSPAMGIRMFREKGLTGDPDFEFPAWNDSVSSSSPVGYRDYYRSISRGDLEFKAEPFENLPLSRRISRSSRDISSRFSSLAFSYGLDDAMNHRIGIWFKPLFNDYFEQNHVDHEIMNLRVLSGGGSLVVSSDGSVHPGEFRFELLAFDSIYPFTGLRKRLSFGLDLSLGMKDGRFLAESSSYAGLAFGNSRIFILLGLGSRLSTVPMECTLNSRTILGASLGPVSILNTLDIVLVSTMHDHLHVEDRIKLKVRVLDNLSLSLDSGIWTHGGPTEDIGYDIGLGIIWNFNIF